MSDKQWIKAPFDHGDDYPTTRSLWTTSSELDLKNHHYDLFLEEMEEVITFFEHEGVEAVEELEFSFYSGNDNDGVLAMTERIISYADHIPKLKWLKVDSYFFEDFPTWKVLDAFPDLKAFYMEGTGCDWGIRRMHNLEYLVLDQGEPETALQGCAFPSLKHFGCNTSGTNFIDTFNAASFSQLVHLGMPSFYDDVDDQLAIDDLKLPVSLSSIALTHAPNDTATQRWAEQIQYVSCTLMIDDSKDIFTALPFKKLQEANFDDSNDNGLDTGIALAEKHALRHVSLRDCDLTEEHIERLLVAQPINAEATIDLSDNHIVDEDVQNRLRQRYPNIILLGQTEQIVEDDDDHEDDDDYE